jgi:hypothetical protein
VGTGGSLPPIPPGEARVWFDRDAGPYDSQEQPYIEMNGAIVGVSQPRGSFFIDVKPGFYHVTVQQYLNSPEEAANINLVPGQQVYLRIVLLTDCIAGGGSLRTPGYSRRASISGTYQPQVAQADAARTSFYGGR